MLLTNFSSKAKVILSFLLALTLSGTVAAEAFLLNSSFPEKEELSLTDEESKSENERTEENNAGKGSENKYEGGGSDDKPLKHKFEFVSANRVSYSQIGCSYSYYPHLNNSYTPPRLTEFYPKFKLFIQFHRLVYYH